MSAPTEALKRIPMIDSPGSEIFCAWRGGEITEADWVTMEAISMAEKRLSFYQPDRAPDMPIPVRNYCESRCAGTMPYDNTLAVRLGNWFRTIQAVIDKNQDKFEVLEWAHGKLIENGLVDLGVNVRRTMDRFHSLRQPEGLDLALATKKIDAAARSKGAA